MRRLFEFSALLLIDLNRSAIAAVTLHTYGNTSTQADMLQFGLERDQFDEGNLNTLNTQEAERKDLRIDNFTKKNVKAMHKHDEAAAAAT